jgi:hypothetical protein
VKDVDCGEIAVMRSGHRSIAKAGDCILRRSHGRIMHGGSAMNAHALGRTGAALAMAVALAAPVFAASPESSTTLPAERWHSDLR